MQTSANDISFNFETKTVSLISGYEMLIYGIGTYSLLNEECVNSVGTALENGVRLIDTAHMYHNEEMIFVCCPLCGSKIRIKIRLDKALERFPLNCPKCKQEILKNVKELNISVFKEPDA